MQEKPFVTLAAPAEHREEVKGSVFLAYAQRADALQQVNPFLGKVCARHPEASHLCWAYRMGGQYRFSDGGEPGGTAGQPILRAIEGQGLDYIVVGVIRYFGGTLLGAGGLMRAYGGVAAEALRTATRLEVQPSVRLSLDMPFEHTGALYRLLDAFDVEDRSETYTSEGIRMSVKLMARDVGRFERLLLEATRGQGKLRRAE